MTKDTKRKLISFGLTLVAAALTAMIPLIDLIDFEAMLAQVGIVGIAGLTTIMVATIRAVLKEALEYITAYLERRAARKIEENPPTV